VVLASMMPTAVADYLDEDTFSPASVGVRNHLIASIEVTESWAGLIRRQRVVTQRIPASMRGAVEIVDPTSAEHRVVRMIPIVESDDEW